MEFCRGLPNFTQFSQGIFLIFITFFNHPVFDRGWSYSAEMKYFQMGIVDYHPAMGLMFILDTLYRSVFSLHFSGHTSPSLTLWVGTVSGHVFIFQLKVAEPEQRQTEDVECLLGE